MIPKHKTWSHLWLSHATKSSLEKEIFESFPDQQSSNVTLNSLQFNEGPITNVCEGTVRRTVHRIDYVGRRLIRKPPLLALNKNKCLRFAKEFKEQIVDD
ncbi:hypothetical protein TNCV_624951 [Trichonephila clavipes]|nr:hypothetical protein TNCV_624951 [Trichonephila clavipes]